MKEREISVWKYDYKKLDGWNIHDKIPWRFDKMTGHSGSDTACLIYSIGEVRMCTEMGYLAVFKDNHDPKLVMNITSLMFPMQDPFYSNDGRYIILKAQVYIKEIDRVEILILFLDVVDMKFSNFKMKGNNYSYQFEEISPTRFAVKVDEYQKSKGYVDDIMVMLDNLVWFPVSELKNDERRWLSER